MPEIWAGRGNGRQSKSKIVFKHIVAYNVCMETREKHPALAWEQAARQPGQLSQTRLRLAAMAGHFQLDKIAARRAALIDLLADGRPHPAKKYGQRLPPNSVTKIAGAKYRPKHWPAIWPLYVREVFASLIHVGQRYRDIICNTPLWHGRPSVRMNLSVGNLLRLCASFPFQRKTNAPLPPPILPCAKNNSCWPKKTPTGQPQK